LLARTIADRLGRGSHAERGNEEKRKKISPQHLAEALQYRPGSIAD